MTDKELMEAINDQWCDNEEHMGEMTALEAACEMYGKTSEWFYAHVELIAVKPEELGSVPLCMPNMREALKESSNAR